MLAAFSHPELNFTYESEEDIRENIVIIEVLFTSMSTSEIREVRLIGQLKIIESTKVFKS